MPYKEKNATCTLIQMQIYEFFVVPFIRKIQNKAYIYQIFVSVKTNLDFRKIKQRNNLANLCFNLAKSRKEKRKADFAFLSCVLNNLSSTY
jgi:hypothetical protein